MCAKLDFHHKYRTQAHTQTHTTKCKHIINNKFLIATILFAFTFQIHRWIVHGQQEALFLSMYVLCAVHQKKEEKKGKTERKIQVNILIFDAISKIRSKRMEQTSERKSKTQENERKSNGMNEENVKKL